MCCIRIDRRVGLLGFRSISSDSSVIALPWPVRPSHHGNVINIVFTIRKGSPSAFVRHASRCRHLEGLYIVPGLINLIEVSLSPLPIKWALPTTPGVTATSSAPRCHACAA